MSTIQAAAELTTLYPGDVELAAAVVQAWEKVTQGMLLGRIVWSLRTRKLLGVVG